MNKTTTSGVRSVVITEANDGQRLDNFLQSQLKGVPKSRLYRLLRKGEVRVNKKRAKPSDRLSAGDVVRIPPVRLRQPDEDQSRLPQSQIDRVLAAIVHEDEDLLALNKPSGLAVHGGSGVRFGVIDLLRAARPEAPFLELVHRLDRETSGCLLIAKNRPALLALQAAMKGTGMRKVYQALVMGHWRGGEIVVEAPLRKNLLQGGERLVRVDEQGRPARSRFYPLREFARATLVRVEIDTGRTHQIRVHAAHSGHPLAGDGKYGDAGFNAELKEHGLRRLFLHAELLEFQHPRSGKKTRVRSPLGGDLTEVINNIS